MRKIPNCSLIGASAGAMLLFCAPASAKDGGVTIAKAATKHMQCTSGVCAPTAADAVLSVRELAKMLKSGSVEVTTTGSGIQANNIAFDAPLSWTGVSTLSLNALADITVGAPINVKGTGGITLTSASGNTLFFSKKGAINFKKLKSRLTIDGNSYTLVKDVGALADDIAENAAGDYALARNYNAGPDGVYSEAPIPTTFTGIFEGLGHKISNLTIIYSGATAEIGLFSYVQSSPGKLRDLGLVDVDISVSGVTGQKYWVGALAGASGDGEIQNDFATGRVTFSGAGVDYTGGLIGYGAVTNSWAADDVTASSSDTSGVIAGGLVGDCGGDIVDSYAIGTVTAQSVGGFVSAGGLAGCDGNYGEDVTNSYATGNVSASTGSNTGTAAAGGLLGAQTQDKAIASSYSTGSATAVGAQNNYAGGSVGMVFGAATFTDAYWDTSTNGTDTGVGNGNWPGLTGLTTLELQSGLPSGFSPAIWRENAKTADGLPFLIANLPVH